ncbi:MAG TPA: hypothetical protein VK986_03975 [Tepidisphaeraceae bacterium]|nr:hypothetical protein [Tepidisphaeraceae bacterium]
MFRTSKRRIAGLVAIGGAALLAGCQDTGVARDPAGPMPEKGVMCSKCQITYLESPLAKGSPFKYTTEKMECPDCKSAVANFFATGKLEHACKTCGPDALKICDRQH